MFNLTQKRTQQELAGVMTQIINRCTPRAEIVDDENRSSKRYHRTIPVVVGPWDNGDADIDQFTIAITKDISDQGMAVAVPHGWNTPKVLCGFWTDVATLVQGAVRQRLHLGGNFWQLGIEFEEVVRPARIPNFEQLNHCLCILDPERLYTSRDTFAQIEDRSMVRSK